MYSEKLTLLRLNILNLELTLVFYFLERCVA